MSSRSDAPLQLCESRLRRRYRFERLFRAAGAGGVLLAVSALGVLLASITVSGLPGFLIHRVALDVLLTPEVIGVAPGASLEDLAKADFGAALKGALQQEFPDVTERKARRDLRALLSSGADFELRKIVLADPALLGSARIVSLPLADDVDLLLKGSLPRDLPESDRVISDAQLRWLDALSGRGRIERSFNLPFFTSGDSREPELAGVGGALIGSALTLLITLLLCVPMGVAAAVHLEEFSAKNQLTNWIEVNINNLAAVPSIVFGLFGLGIFLNLFGMPRSAPLVGGIVLSLMTLPTIILASRAAIQAVPPSIRAGALAMGASPMQAVLHHVVPLALPGILTGTIIGMARALGETAPLLMIGMVAFIVDLPTGFTSPSTVLPVQIYLWSDSPERAFAQKTAAAILVLILFLLAMNLLAVILRRRFERRW
jgi:phosphate transport system permease protein